MEKAALLLLGFTLCLIIVFAAAEAGLVISFFLIPYLKHLSLSKKIEQH